MLDSKIIDVFIGLFFTFLMYSLLATTIREAIAGILDQRANTLYRGIRSMCTNTREYDSAFDKIFGIFTSFCRSLVQRAKLIFHYQRGKAFHERFYHHPILKNYGQNLFFSKPSYINPKNFSAIMIDTAKNAIVDADGKEVYRDKAVTPSMISEFLALNGVKNDVLIPDGHQLNVLPESDFIRILNYHFEEAGCDIDVFKDRLELWFNDTMDRVSGWYKRNNQIWLFCIGLMMAMIFNTDSIEITHNLLKNDKARDQLVNMAQASLAKSGSEITSTDQEIIDKAYDNVKTDIKEVNDLIGFGWDKFGINDSDYIHEITFMDKPESVSCFSRLFPLRRLKQKIYWETIPLRNLAVDKTVLQNNNPISKSYLNMFLVNKFQNDIYHNNEIYFQAWYLYSKINYNKILGFLITAIAVSLGAPFWFDLLSKVMKLRSTGKQEKVVEPPTKK